MHFPILDYLPWFKISKISFQVGTFTSHSKTLNIFNVILIYFGTPISTYYKENFINAWSNRVSTYWLFCLFLRKKLLFFVITNCLQFFHLTVINEIFVISFLEHFLFVSIFIKNVDIRSHGQRISRWFEFIDSLKLSWLPFF